MRTFPEYLERERVLRRLSEGDEELARALDRMKLNFYHLWLVLEELRTSTDPNGLLRGWREAPKGSIGWRKALFYAEAMEVLRVALSGRP
jgi:hypothetical protein